MAEKYARWATSLTGGGDGALDSYDGASLLDGEMALANVPGDKFYIYVLNATSGAAESVPDVIAPDSNAGLKRWILQSIHTKIDGIKLSEGTDIGAALADTDLILVDDGAGGTNRKCAMSRLKTYLISAGLVLSIINSWESLITPDITISPIVNEEITWS
ncbi:MAG TPA: hypothetical protein VMW53_07725 [archaeon]|nr:hypothetical protein [archaeon]